jgi:hypothetical protein
LDPYGLGLQMHFVIKMLPACFHLGGIHLFLVEVAKKSAASCACYASRDVFLAHILLCVCVMSALKIDFVASVA